MTLTLRKRPLHAGLLLLALALTARAAVAGEAPKATVSVGEFRPTQMEIGHAAVGYHITKWQRDAASRGMSFADYARDVLRPKFAATHIGAVIDPEGNLRNTDAHHRMSALRRVTELTGVKFEIGAKILADYRGKTKAEYADHFINTLKKGQFTAEVEKLPVEERMKHLPATYAGLGNNALRSSLEIAFGTHGIDGGWMRDYVEFRIARRMLEGGILDELKAEGVVPKNARKVPVRLATDPRVVAAVAKRLPALREYLLSEALDDEHRATLASAIDKMAQ